MDCFFNSFCSKLNIFLEILLGSRFVISKVFSTIHYVWFHKNQIFTINISDSNKVSVHSYPLSFDSLMTYQKTGLSLVLSREEAQIFELK